MPRVRFIRNFDYSPSALKNVQTTGFKAGQICNVNAECWQLAKKDKAAELAPKSEGKKQDEQQD